MKRNLAPLVLLLLTTGLASAATHSVEQDGSGDYVTIGEAIAAAVSGDSVLVGPGLYAQDLHLDGKVLTLASTSGPELTVLSGDGSFRILEIFNGGGGTLDGFTLIDGVSSSGGAIIVNPGSLDVRNCVFENNASSHQGGAVSIGNASTVHFYDCDFLRNSAVRHSGAVVAIQGTLCTFDGCSFVENVCTDYSSAAIAGHSSTMNVYDCLFLRNDSAGFSGGIYLYQCTADIRGNTFHDNRSAEGTIKVHESAPVLIERNIFSGEQVGRAIASDYYSSFTHHCNLYWDNAGGNVFPGDLESDEVVADPYYCSPAEDNFHLHDISAANPENSLCGMLIGAFPVGCSTTGVESSSWSLVKSLY